MSYKKANPNAPDTNFFNPSNKDQNCCGCGEDPVCLNTLTYAPAEGFSATGVTIDGVNHEFAQPVTDPSLLGAAIYIVLSNSSTYTNVNSVCNDLNEDGTYTIEHEGEVIINSVTIGGVDQEFTRHCDVRCECPYVAEVAPQDENITIVGGETPVDVGAFTHSTNTAQEVQNAIEAALPADIYSVVVVDTGSSYEITLKGAEGLTITVSGTPADVCPCESVYYTKEEEKTKKVPAKTAEAPVKKAPKKESK